MGEDGKTTLNENETCKKHGHSAKRWLVSVSFILFLFNIWEYLNTPGAEIPILSLLLPCSPAKSSLNTAKAACL